ncbi:MAG: aminoacyl-tRNA deacylase [Anaerolineales bacterium]
MEPAEVQRRLDALRRRLDEAGAEYEILPHAVTYHTAEDGVTHGVGTLAEMAPTFILRTKQGYLAAIISGATRMSYKKIKRRLGLRDISMADPETVAAVTGARIGTVSLVNVGLKTIVDERLVQGGTGYGGCGVPRHTLKIAVDDLVRVTAAEVFDFTEPKTG